MCGVDTYSVVFLVVPLVSQKSCGIPVSLQKGAGSTCNSCKCMAVQNTFFQPKNNGRHVDHHVPRGPLRLPPPPPSSSSCPSSSLESMNPSSRLLRSANVSVHASNRKADIIILTLCLASSYCRHRCALHAGFSFFLLSPRQPHRAPRQPPSQMTRDPQRPRDRRFASPSILTRPLVG